MESKSVIITRTFDASADKIWRALTDISQMKQWYFPMLEDFRPEAGFETQFNVHHEGKDFLHIWKVREVIPMEKISYEWKFGGYPGNSLLTFELDQDGENTQLTLKHDHLETFLGDQNPELSAENFHLGWSDFMDRGLKEFLEKQN